MRISFLQAGEKFTQKHGEAIGQHISELHPLIREAAEFVTKTADRYEEMVGVDIGLPVYEDESGFLSFHLSIEFDEKIRFWLHCNDEEPIVVDIEGFDCWNQLDEDRMYEIRKKSETGQGKRQETCSSGPSRSPPIARLEP